MDTLCGDGYTTGPWKKQQLGVPPPFPQPKTVENPHLIFAPIKFNY